MCNCVRVSVDILIHISTRYQRRRKKRKEKNRNAGQGEEESRRTEKDLVRSRVSNTDHNSKPKLFGICTNTKMNVV